MKRVRTGNGSDRILRLRSLTLVVLSVARNPVATARGSDKALRILSRVPLSQLL